MLEDRLNTFLKGSYENQRLGDYLPTEGDFVDSDNKGTLLNTSYFANAVYDGIGDDINGEQYPYKEAAYLLLNALPFKYNTNNIANFKKESGVYEFPYSFVLWLGSLYNRLNEREQHGQEYNFNLNFVEKSGNGVINKFDSNQYDRFFSPPAGNNVFIPFARDFRLGTQNTMLDPSRITKDGVVGIGYGMYNNFVERFNYVLNGTDALNIRYHFTYVHEMLIDDTLNYFVRSDDETNFNFFGLFYRLYRFETTTFEDLPDFSNEDYSHLDFYNLIVSYLHGVYNDLKLDGVPSITKKDINDGILDKISGFLSSKVPQTISGFTSEFGVYLDLMNYFFSRKENVNSANEAPDHLLDLFIEEVNKTNRGIINKSHWGSYTTLDSSLVISLIPSSGGLLNIPPLDLDDDINFAPDFTSNFELNRDDIVKLNRNGFDYTQSIFNTTINFLWYGGPYLTESLNSLPNSYELFYDGSERYKVGENVKYISSYEYLEFFDREFLEKCETEFLNFASTNIGVHGFNFKQLLRAFMVVTDEDFSEVELTNGANADRELQYKLMANVNYQFTSFDEIDDVEFDSNDINIILTNAQYNRVEKVLSEFLNESILIRNISVFGGINVGDVGDGLASCLFNRLNLGDVNDVEFIRETLLSNVDVDPYSEMFSGNFTLETAYNILNRYRFFEWKHGATNINRPNTLTINGVNAYKKRFGEEFVTFNNPVITFLPYNIVNVVRDLYVRLDIRPSENVIKLMDKYVRFFIAIFTQEFINYIDNNLKEQIVSTIETLHNAIPPQEFIGDITVTDTGKKFVLNDGDNALKPYIDNVLTPVIFSYEKVFDNAFNSFVDEIKSLMDKGQKGFDSYLQGFTGQIDEYLSDLNEKEKRDKKKDKGAVSSNDIKVRAYYNIKTLYDSWISFVDEENVDKMVFNFNTVPDCNDVQSDFDNRDLIDYFQIVDRGNRDIGRQTFVDLTYLADYFGDEFDGPNMNTSFYTFLDAILNEHGFRFHALPAYIDFAADQQTTQAAFGTYETLSKIRTSPAFLCQYLADTSSQLFTPSNKYKNSKALSFCLEDNFNDSENTSNIPTEMLNSGTPTSFIVDFGIPNQQIFNNVTLDQSEFMNTIEYFDVITNMTKRYAETAGSNLYKIYTSRSYTCQVEMLGDMMVQPLMFFYLKHVPMFYGTYWITNVTHTIEANHMKTNFKGVRQPISVMPKQEDIIISLNEDFAKTFGVETDLEDYTIKTDKTVDYPPATEIVNGKIKIPQKLKDVNFEQMLEKKVMQPINKNFSSKLVSFTRDDLISVMYLESRLKPDEINEITGEAIGLLQFTSDAFDAINNPNKNKRRANDPNRNFDIIYQSKDIQVMDVGEQLELVADWLFIRLNSATDIPVRNVYDLYILNFYPVAVGKPDDFILGTQPDAGKPPEDIASVNPSLDINEDGVISVSEIKRWISDRLGPKQK